MKILLNGIQSNLRFSSAHVIPGHESCGFIHGHSYFVDVEIEGERAGEFQFVVDFKDVKMYTKAICDELDHRLLIPVYNDLIEFKDFNKKSDSIFDLKKEKSVYFKIDGKGYTIPSVDCVFLPLPYTSAEELSKGWHYIAIPLGDVVFFARSPILLAPPAMNTSELDWDDVVYV